MWWREGADWVNRGGVFLQSHGMGTHVHLTMYTSPQALILELLKGLLDRGVYVLGGLFGQVFCPCGHGLRVLDGLFGQVFCPCGHGLRVLDGLFGQVFCPCGHGLRVLDGLFGQVFCPCGHGLRVLDGLFGQVFCPCGQGLRVLDGLFGQVFFLVVMPCMFWAMRVNMSWVMSWMIGGGVTMEFTVSS